MSVLETSDSVEMDILAMTKPIVEENVKKPASGPKVLDDEDWDL
ncbi:hypothetical protein [Edaphobacter aggregans]|nr:hypothetical protein [Edaphobacter aggregans]